MMVLDIGGVCVCWRGDVARGVTLCVCVWCGCADNDLDAEGVAALAPALGNLVSLTSLDLRST